MKTVLSSLLLICFVSFTFGQSDPAAKQLLDQLSSETASKENIEIKFSYSFENPEKNIPKSEEDGYLLIAGEKYLIELMGMEQFSAGAKIYRVLHDDETVEMMSSDDEEESLSPSKILSMYEEGYKFRMMSKESSNGNDIQWIRLYPESAESAPYTHIDLAVNTTQMQIHQIVEQGKNGTITTYSITSYRTNITLKGNEFTYSEGRFPDYELVDLDF